LEPTDIPIAMVFLARDLARSNPSANILAGVVMTLVQALSVVGRLSDGYYPFFSSFEPGHGLSCRLRRAVDPRASSL
jgi:hypothetical protein